MSDRTVPSRFERSGSTVRFYHDGALVAVTICTSRIVRIELADERDVAGPSYVGPRSWAGSPFEILEGERIRLSTAHLQVETSTRPVRLTLFDAAGAWLLREPAHGGMLSESVGDTRRRLRASFEFSDEQHFYGLGQGGRQLDRLGIARQLWNTHIGHGPGSDMGIPLLVSNRGYALFFDNTSDAMLSVGRSDGGVRITYTAEAGRLVWYFLIGRDLRGVMFEVAELLGRPPLPPRWALGFLQSTRHFDDTEELRRLPRTIREKRIPCDGLIYLSTYGEAQGWNRGVGHLGFQPSLWRDPPALIDEARQQHFEIITHEYPVLHEQSPLFAEAEANGYLLDEGYGRASETARRSANYREGQRYLDFSNPAVGAWWWAAHRELVKLGVAGWWLDGGEGPPATAKLHAGEGTLLHNIYDRFRHEAFAVGEAADRPDQRVFLLCRSGGAGMQRFGATCWSGDINNDFETLDAQIPLGLNTGLSGVPYWGTDVGGFFHPVTETGELYARWFQLGAFSPIFRSHGWVWREHVPWAHGAEVEKICRDYAELRYRLLPYTYTLAWQAHTLGLPFMRPLVLNYPDDPRVWQLGHEFLWGDDLLVAPVTREGARTWPVYLPAGGWYDFWSGARYEGPGGITLDAPLDRLPLLVRAGAIVPLGPVVQHTGERPLDEITLLVYPEGASSFELYEDDGRSNAYREGHRALTRFECVTGPKDVTLKIGEPVGDRSVVPANRRYLIRLRMDRARAVAVEGHGVLPRGSTPTGNSAAWWEDPNGFIVIRPPFRPTLAVTVT
ncbi:MAG TPA: TIM-barrel domain-containing protein [Methylomirabilota bacterium]|jgi:alpha-glucosidase (family GH31 glycosyl hydrolase)|nr:TIM-barrel domain-containing protein [Methylomirabilota bacterium]